MSSWPFFLQEDAADILPALGSMAFLWCKLLSCAEHLTYCSLLRALEIQTLSSFLCQLFSAGAVGVISLSWKQEVSCRNSVLNSVEAALSINQKKNSTIKHKVSERPYVSEYFSLKWAFHFQPNTPVTVIQGAMMLCTLACFIDKNTKNSR